MNTIIQAMRRKEKLPVYYVKNMKTMYSGKILEKYLTDYDKYMKIKEKLKKSYYNTYFSLMNSNILKICLIKGIDSIESIGQCGIDDEICEVCFSKSEIYRLEILLYNMGYAKEPVNKNRNHKKNAITSLCNQDFSEVVNYFLDDMKLSQGHKVAKVGYFNRFFTWINEVIGVNEIKDICYLKREIWYKYIQYTDALDKTNKTKESFLLPIVQFYEWLKVKKPLLISNEFIPQKTDYKKFHQYSPNKSLAFIERRHVEKILKYLVNDFRAQNIDEEFFKAAILISANTGLRVSEIRRIEYNTMYWDGEENIHKILIDYPDKYGVINKVVYVTKHGAEEIKRIENIRKEKTNLVAKYNKRVGRKFIHLFELHAVNAIPSNKINTFIDKIKIRLGITDEEGIPLEGYMHGFRHFYAVTIFRESNYNISVLRHLLRHEDYKISEKYLSEEIENVVVEVGESEVNKNIKIAGKGIEELVNIVLNKSTSNEVSIKVIDKFNWLQDIIKSNNFKKLDLGYCFNPCEKRKNCYKCNKWIIDENESEELLKKGIYVFELICFKMYIFNIDLNNLDNSEIREEIENLLVIIEELKVLGYTEKDVVLKITGEKC